MPMWFQFFSPKKKKKNKKNRAHSLTSCLPARVYTVQIFLENETSFLNFREDKEHGINLNHLHGLSEVQSIFYLFETGVLLRSEMSFLLKHGLAM